MTDTTASKRILLSFIAQETHRMLIWVLVLFCVVLGSVYLFLLNQVAMNGYVLTKEAEKRTDIVRELESLDSRLAKFDTREYLRKKTEIGYAFTTSGARKFLFVKEVFTAKR